MAAWAECVGWIRAGRKTPAGDASADRYVLVRRRTTPAAGVAVAPPVGHLSLEGVHGTVAVPDHQAGFWRQWRAFVGPAMLVSVGYMDPGNWGTDLQGGAQFKYGLLWVVGLASLMAIFMQVISARLGVVTGKDLAQCCRDWYPRWTRWPNWLMCEVAIGACDLAEVLGSAVRPQPAVPHPAAVGGDHHRAWTCCCCWACNGSGCARSRPSCSLLVATIGGLLLHRDLRPSADPSELSRDGAGPVQPELSPGGDDLSWPSASSGPRSCRTTCTCTRPWCRAASWRSDERSIRRAIRFNTIDSTVALTIAFFVNAAIMVLAAIVFYGKESVTCPPVRRVVTFSPRERLDSHRLPDAGAAAGHAPPPARCSPWRCWPAGRAARSPARWPGRW